LECVPTELAGTITQSLNMPTIGIGAGVNCDGQALVTNDLLGLFDKFKPKFVKRYVDLSEAMLAAFTAYKEEVEKSVFPSKEYSYK